MKKYLIVLPVLLVLFVVSCAKKAEVSKSGDSTSVAATTAPALTPVERGRYLVTAVAGCGDCHTPWKMGQHGPEPDMSRMLSGHPEGMKMSPAPKLQMPWMAAIAATFTSFSGPFGTSYAHNLTPDSTGLGAWDETTFMLALRNGKHIGTGRPIMPPMPWQNFKNMTDDDLKAIFAYLKSIPPIKNKAPEYEPPAGGPPMAGGPPKK